MKGSFIKIIWISLFAMVLLPGFSAAGCKSGSSICIGLVTDVGVIGDKSFVLKLPLLFPDEFGYNM